MENSQLYPKALYRHNGDELLCTVVKTPEEHASAQQAGWGEHPSTRKPEPAPEQEKPQFKNPFTKKG